MKNESQFEHIASSYIATVISHIPNTLHGLVFSSSVCTRSPDVCMIWHDGFRMRNQFEIVSKYIFRIVKAFLLLPFTIFCKKSVLFYILCGKKTNTLLVLEESFCNVTKNGVISSSYIALNEGDFLFVYTIDKANKLPIGAYKTYTISLGRKISTVYWFLLGGLHGFFNISATFYEKFLIVCEWFLWTLSCAWLSNGNLESVLINYVSENQIKKIGCVHEMHPYSRVIWHVARRFNVKGYTIQHASISKEKKWYICTEKERVAGLAVPNVMHVYNKEVIALLKPVYEETEFRLGCSNRYALWKKETACAEPGNTFLFVGALARFDNEIIVAALHRIIVTTASYGKLKVRLHPLAQFKKEEKKWLLACEKQGKIKISRNTTLENDLKEAACVVGANTTVLEEALVLGRSVIQLHSEKYLVYISLVGVRGVEHIDCNNIQYRDLEQHANCDVDVAVMRARFGLEYPIITYDHLFGNDED